MKLVHGKIAIYDNPTNAMREVYDDGVLQMAISNILFQREDEIMPWVDGQIQGDPQGLPPYLQEPN